MNIPHVNAFFGKGSTQLAGFIFLNVLKIVKKGMKKKKIHFI